MVTQRAGAGQTALLSTTSCERASVRTTGLLTRGGGGAGGPDNALVSSPPMRVIRRSGRRRNCRRQDFTLQFARGTGQAPVTPCCGAQLPHGRRSAPLLGFNNGKTGLGH